MAVGWLLRVKAVAINKTKGNRFFMGAGFELVIVLQK